MKAYLEHNISLADSSQLIAIIICFLICFSFPSFGLKIEASRGMVWYPLSTCTETSDNARLVGKVTNPLHAPSVSYKVVRESSVSAPDR